ncbi:FAD-dependent monooxygenase sdnN [Trichinella spiralis]|uniref:FAD-dependent monooxygenase sdnN n=1 Tax=Trichinella spiralis TaxID=6334 RepID=A0ABR3KXD0_TRISP
MSASLLDGDWDLNRGRLCLLDDHCHRRLACALFALNNTESSCKRDRERQKDSKSLLCGQLESSASGSYPSLSTAPAISLRSSSVKPLDVRHC